MGYIPIPPPQYPVHHTAPPISAADDDTFDRWMALPSDDTRTLAEFAANPVPRETTWHFGPKPPPPPAPPRARTGEISPGQRAAYEAGYIHTPPPPAPPRARTGEVREDRQKTMRELPPNLPDVSTFHHEFPPPPPDSGGTRRC